MLQGEGQGRNHIDDGTPIVNILHQDNNTFHGPDSSPCFSLILMFSIFVPELKIE